MKLTLTIFTGLLAASTLAAAHPHQVPAPPAPPAPPALPAHPSFAPPALPAVPAMPEMPPAPPLPLPPPTIDIPDDVLAACEGKADRSRLDMAASNGAHISGVCHKHGNVYAFVLESYRLHTASPKHAERN